MLSSFQIIKAEARLAQMMTWFGGIQQKITDFVTGGKTRSKLEAVAVEMEAQDFQIYRAIKKAIPVSVYQAFNFNLLPPSAASGTLTFQAAAPATQDIPIALGTQVATVATAAVPETVYATTAAAVLPAGQTSVQVPFAAISAGAGGNTGPNTIVVLKTTITGIASVTNVLGANNGTNLELEASRRVRFTEFIATLSRGTEAAVIYGVKTAYLTDSGGNITERVVGAQIAEPPDSGSAGSFTCYVYNGTNGASSALVTLAQQITVGYTDATGNKISGYKAAGIIATVAAASTLALDVSAAIQTAPGSNLTLIQSQIATAIASYFQTMRIGSTFVYNDLVTLIMNVVGVVDVAISTPVANHAATASQIIIAGNVTATVT